MLFPLIIPVIEWLVGGVYTLELVVGVGGWGGRVGRAVVQVALGAHVVQLGRRRVQITREANNNMLFQFESRFKKKLSLIKETISR